MEQPRPVLNQVNILAREVQASLAFYRLLGVKLGDAVEWPPGSGVQHAAVQFLGSHSLEIDNPPMQRLYIRDAEQVRSAAVVGFAFASAEAVDAAYERITGAGHPSRQPPFDAFWGARYALVEDPDGNAVGLMGPIDRSRGYVPSGPPSA